MIHISLFSNENAQAWNDRREYEEPSTFPAFAFPQKWKPIFTFSPTPSSSFSALISVFFRNYLTRNFETHYIQRSISPKSILQWDSTRNTELPWDNQTKVWKWLYRGTTRECEWMWEWKWMIRAYLRSAGHHFYDVFDVDGECWRWRRNREIFLWMNLWREDGESFTSFFVGSYAKTDSPFSSLALFSSFLSVHSHTHT